MKITKVIVVIVLALVNYAVGQKTSSIIPVNAKVQKIFDGGFFTEGPAPTFDGNVYFSDITFTSQRPKERGHIWKYSSKTGRTIIYRSPSGMTNGLEVDNHNNLFACEGGDFGGRRITKTDSKTGKSQIIAAVYNGKPFNSPNDLVVDSKERIYFTDPRYVGSEQIEQSVMGVYRIESNGDVKLIIGDISMPNGIALSPKEDKLYVGCNDESDSQNNPKNLMKGMFVAEYQLSSTGEVKFIRKLVNYESDIGPDGLTVDSNGNLYVAVRDEQNPYIGIYNPDGKILATISMPEVPSNVAFGKGKEKNCLYITAGGSLYRIRLLSQGMN